MLTNINVMEKKDVRHCITISNLESEISEPSSNLVHFRYVYFRRNTLKKRYEVIFSTQPPPPISGLNCKAGWMLLHSGKL